MDCKQIYLRSSKKYNLIITSTKKAFCEQLSTCKRKLLMGLNNI